jgi:hypothetical protein
MDTNILTVGKRARATGSWAQRGGAPHGAIRFTSRSPHRRVSPRLKRRSAGTPPLEAVLFFDLSIKSLGHLSLATALLPIISVPQELERLCQFIDA